MSAIYQSITELVGKTPILRANNFEKENDAGWLRKGQNSKGYDRGRRAEGYS